MEKFNIISIFLILLCSAFRGASANLDQPLNFPTGRQGNDHSDEDWSYSSITEEDNESYPLSPDSFLEGDPQDYTNDPDYGIHDQNKHPPMPPVRLHPDGMLLA